MVGEDGQFEREATNPVFKWSLDLDDDEKKKLLGGGTVEKETNVNFKKDDGLNLWPREKAGIVVDSNKYGQMLMITYSQWVDRLVSLLEMGKTGGYVDSVFTCNWAELVSNNADLIYKGGTVADPSLQYRDINEKPLKIKVSINRECYVNDRGKQLECNLK